MSRIESDFFRAMLLLEAAEPTNPTKGKPMAKGHACEHIDFWVIHPGSNCPACDMETELVDEKIENESLRGRVGELENELAGVREELATANGNIGP